MLLQEVDSTPVQKVVDSLKRHARKAKSLRLAKLASQVQAVGHFDVVIQQIKKMEQVLKTEEKEDMDTKDWCKAETFKNEEEASKYEYKVEKMDAKVGKLEDKITSLEMSVKETVKEIEDTKA